MVLARFAREGLSEVESEIEKSEASPTSNKRRSGHQKTPRELQAQRSLQKQFWTNMPWIRASHGWEKGDETVPSNAMKQSQLELEKGGDMSDKLSKKTTADLPSYKFASRSGAVQGKYRTLNTAEKVFFSLICRKDL